MSDIHAVVMTLSQSHGKGKIAHCHTCEFLQWEWTVHKLFVHKKAPRIMKQQQQKKNIFFCPCYLKVTVNRNESVCLIASCLARNGTFSHEMMIWWWYEMHHNTNWYKLLLGNLLFWKCYEPAVFTDGSVWFCSIQMQHVSMNQCVWGLIQCTLRCEPRQTKIIQISVSCECTYVILALYTV